MNNWKKTTNAVAYYTLRVSDTEQLIASQKDADRKVSIGYVQKLGEAGSESSELIALNKHGIAEIYQENPVLTRNIAVLRYRSYFENSPGLPKEMRDIASLILDSCADGSTDLSTSSECRQ